MARLGELSALIVQLALKWQHQDPLRVCDIPILNTQRGYPPRGSATIASREDVGEDSNISRIWRVDYLINDSFGFPFRLSIEACIKLPTRRLHSSRSDASPSALALTALCPAQPGRFRPSRRRAFLNMPVFRTSHATTRQRGSYHVSRRVGYPVTCREISLPTRRFATALLRQSLGTPSRN